MNKEIDLLLLSAVQIYSKESLLERLLSDKVLKIKLGADPSCTDLHLGHSVVLRALRLFQDMGHEVIFVVGDYTAMIGDPSGKSKTRPSLTFEETRMYGETYLNQVTKILDKTKTRIEYNSTWLSNLSFKDILNLTSKYTVARILERDDFKNRYDKKQPIRIHELLYPLLQGYDSVALNADIEIGGTDQTFNLLVGRELQKAYNQKPQEVITFPILIGLDGVEKMSKSLNNYIGLNESTDIMFEKSMRIPDNLLSDYFKLTTSLHPEYFEPLIKADIREAHIEYGKEIIRMYHGESFIQTAVDRYSKIVNGKFPDNLSVYTTRFEKVSLIEILKAIGFASSSSDARRLIEGKGIKVDNQTITNIHYQLELSKDKVIQFGKSKFIKVSTNQKVKGEPDEN